MKYILLVLGFALCISCIGCDAVVVQQENLTLRTPQDVQYADVIELEAALDILYAQGQWDIGRYYVPAYVPSNWHITGYGMAEGAIFTILERADNANGGSLYVQWLYETDAAMLGTIAAAALGYGAKGEIRIRHVPESSCMSIYWAQDGYILHAITPETFKQKQIAAFCQAKAVIFERAEQ